ncbi:hypothetical protein ACQ4PT_064727 [Festuca glaucescens]
MKDCAADDLHGNDHDGAQPLADNRDTQPALHHRRCDLLWRTAQPTTSTPSTPDDDLIREEQFVNFAPRENHATDLSPDENMMRETIANDARHEDNATDLPEDDNEDNPDEDFGDNEENATQSRKFGLVDTVVAGKSRGDQIGKRIVLPRTFPGGDRDMQRRFLDAMAIV